MNTAAYRHHTLDQKCEVPSYLHVFFTLHLRHAVAPISLVIEEIWHGPATLVTYVCGVWQTWKRTCRCVCLIRWRRSSSWCSISAQLGHVSRWQSWVILCLILSFCALCVLLTLYSLKMYALAAVLLSVACFLHGCGVGVSIVWVLAHSGSRSSDSGHIVGVQDY